MRILPFACASANRFRVRVIPTLDPKAFEHNLSVFFQRPNSGISRAFSINRLLGRLRAKIVADGGESSVSGPVLTLISVRVVIWTSAKLR